jgi:hypothetical protein
MASEDDKAVHQQCNSGDGASASGAKGNEGIPEQSAGVSANVPDSDDFTLRIADEIERAIPVDDRSAVDAALILLAAEVRRLRTEYADLEKRSLAALEQMTASATYEMRREQQEQSELVRLDSEVRRLREESKLFREAGHAAELRIVELETERPELIAYGDGWKQQWEEMRDTMWKPAMDKLARVEALPDRWKGRIMPPDDRWVNAALELEAALRGEP